MEEFLNNKFRRRLSTKFMSYVTLLLAFIVITLTFISIRNTETKVIDLMTGRANLLTNVLLIEVTQAFIQADYNNIQGITEETVKYDKEIELLEFYNHEFMVTNSSKKGRRFTHGEDPILKEVQKNKKATIKREKDSLKFAFPLKVGNSVKGYILMRYSLKKMNKEIKNLYLTGITIFIITLIIGIFFSYALAKSITAPIKALHKGANEIIKGNLSYRIKLDSDDETVIISRAFNEVTSILIEKIGKLEEYTETLARTNKELDKKIQELKSLQDLGKVISSIFNLEELLRAIVQNSTMVMKSNRCSVVLVDPKTGDYFIKVGKGISEELDIVENIQLKSGGAVTDYCVTHKEAIIVTDLETDERFNFPESKKGKKYKSSSFIAVPLIVNERVIGVISITEKMSGEAYTTSDLHLLTIFANQVVIAIENARLYERLVERERIEKELEIAHTIQMNMLPKDYPIVSGIAVSGVSIPAKEVGGDYYDFIPISDKKVGVTIGDVSGKGVPAALMMVMIRSILRAKIMADSKPETIVTELNTHILSESEAKMFVTLFYAVIDAETKEMVYTNAGHNYPLIFHENDDEFESLEDGGLLMGMFEEAVYQEGRVKLKKGDVIVFYTDGIVEAMNEKDEMLGFENLRDIVLKNKHEDADIIRNRIIEETNMFMGTSAQYDDVTLIVVKVNE